MLCCRGMLLSQALPHACVSVLDACTLWVGDPGHGGGPGTPGSATRVWAGASGAPGWDEYLAYESGLAGVKTLLQVP